MNNDFYVLNQAQNFQFPHADCDIYTNNELEFVFFRGAPNYGHHIIQHYQQKHGHLESVSNAVVSDSYIGLLARTYMRLKFISEVYHCFNDRLHHNPIARIVKPLKDHDVWNIEPSMRIYKIDIYLNSLQAELFACIESHVTGNPVDHTYDIAVLENFNTAVQNIRASPLDGKFVWNKMPPHEMHPYVYAHFAIRLWTIVHDLLGITDT
jgi:hypothetical protein